MKILLLAILMMVNMLQLVIGMDGVTQFNTLQCLPANFSVINSVSNLTEIQAFSSVQTLSPSYRLNCSGYVTAWGTFLGGVGIIDVEFQAWREGQQNEYWKVGGNRFEYELTGGDDHDEMAIFEVQNEESMFRIEEGDIIGIYMSGEGNASVQYIVNPNASMYVLFDVTGPESSIFIDDRFTGEILGAAPPIGLLVEQRTGISTHDQPTVASYSPSRVTTTSMPTPSGPIVMTKDTALPVQLIIAIVTAAFTVAVILCLFALVLCVRLRKVRGKKGDFGGTRDAGVYEAVYSIASNREDVRLKCNPSYSSANALNGSTTSIINAGTVISNPIEMQDNMSYSSLVDSISSATGKQRLQESHIYSQPATTGEHFDGIPRSSSLQYYSSVDDQQLGCGEDEADQIRIQDNLSYSATLTRGLDTSSVCGNTPLDDHDDCPSHEYEEPYFDRDDDLMQRESGSADDYLEIQ